MAQLSETDPKLDQIKVTVCLEFKLELKLPREAGLELNT